MFDLTDIEKGFLALAIQGLALRQGPNVFPYTISLARKLGIEENLKGTLQSWIEYGEKSRNKPKRSIVGLGFNTGDDESP